MFPDIAYLEWIAGRPEAATYDLGSSDLRRPTPSGVTPPALASLPTPPGGVTLQAQLADAYDVDTENVLVTAGGTHANFIAFATALPEETPSADAETSPPRVLVEKPGYEPLTATPNGLGATVDRFRRPPDDDYALDPDRIEAAVTDRTECVAVTNRHNPSGAAADRQTLAAASRAAADADTTLLVDEVYAPFRLDPAPDEDGRTAFGGPTAAGLSNAVVTNSLTKFHGFGPLRVGWLVADAEFVDRARSVARHVPALAAPSRRLANRALANHSTLAERSYDRVAANHDRLASFVADRSDLTGFVAPGATYAFLAHDDADGDAVTAAAWDRDLLVVPGRFFGDADRFRVSLGGADPADGLAVLGDVLDDLP